MGGDARSGVGDASLCLWVHGEQRDRFGADSARADTRQNPHGRNLPHLLPGVIAGSGVATDGDR